MHLIKSSVKTLITASLFAGTALTAQAQPIAAADSAFYIQVNLLEMRQSDAGSQLYDWVDDEIIEEIEDEFGTDLVRSLDGISIFGSGDTQTPVVLLHGFLSEAAQDDITEKVLSEVDEARIETQFGQEFITVHADDMENFNIDIDGQEFEQLFLAFGDSNQTLITPSKDILDDFLRNNSVFSDALSSDLIVVQANRSLVQGGLDAKHDIFKNGPWESQFFKNIEQVGLVIADSGDSFTLRAEAVSSTPAMAEALGNIAKGLLSFKSLADDEGELALLDNLDIASNSNVTVFELQVPAELLIDTLD